MTAASPVKVGPADGKRKRAALDRILATHAAWERRTMADLRVAGYNFSSIADARRYQFAQRTVEQMTAAEVVELVMDQREKRKRA
jgi:hypothetical protein